MRIVVGLILLGVMGLCLRSIILYEINSKKRDESDFDAEHGEGTARERADD